MICRPFIPPAPASIRSAGQARIAISARQTSQDRHRQPPPQPLSLDGGAFHADLVSRAHPAKIREAGQLLFERRAANRGKLRLDRGSVGRDDHRRRPTRTRLAHFGAVRIEGLDFVYAALRQVVDRHAKHVAPKRVIRQVRSPPVRPREHEPRPAVVGVDRYRQRRKRPDVSLGQRPLDSPPNEPVQEKHGLARGKRIPT